MSFNIGLSGLRAVNQDLGVISHNIANVSTAGFRSGRSEFAAVYSGGQAGGVEVNNVSQNFDRNGDLMRTGRALDLAISGNGFFALRNTNGLTSYTRAGLFQRDANNYLVASTGDRLQGYQADANGTLQTGVVGDLQVSTASIAAKASTQLDFVANLKAGVTAKNVAFNKDDSSTYHFSQSSRVYDSLGVEHTLTQYYVRDNSSGTPEWRVYATFDGNATNLSGAAHAVVNFDSDGKLVSTVPAAPTGASLTVTPALTSGAAPLNLSINLSKVTQFGSDFSVSYNQSNGYTSGELTGVAVDSDGGVYATFTNGQRLLQGQVVMANFTNPNGLLQADNTTWQQTFSSGQPVIGAPGTGTMGTLTSGAYEGSNVDLSGELVNLMTAQRNYQANSKSISSADKMTQVLFNSF